MRVVVNLKDENVQKLRDLAGRLGPKVEPREHASALLNCVIELRHRELIDPPPSEAGA